jgi:hypothetical protein
MANAIDENETVCAALEKLRGLLSPAHGSRERSLALTNLEQAEMWLRKDTTLRKALPQTEPSEQKLPL